MDDEVTPHGEPLRFADGTSLAVETCDGRVRLVTRGADVRGIMLAPFEAQQFARNVLAAAFTAKGQLGDEPA